MFAIVEHEQKIALLEQIEERSLGSPCPGNLERSARGNSRAMTADRSSDSRSTHHAPSRNVCAKRDATSSANRVLPTPPVPSTSTRASRLQ